MTFTREDLQRDYNLSEDDVRETLRACGLSLKKRNYSEGERERFAQARRMFDEGTANSYDDIANHFKSNGAGAHTENNGNGHLSEELAEDLRLLEQQAMETGFELGLEQAEIMGKVIPQVTILRLKEMIVSGELKHNFQRIWAEATNGMGNAETLSERVEGQWKEYQIQKYQPPMSLPESSTESSGNDY
jgi:hypothetical protein